LEDEGVLGEVSIAEFPLNFLPLEPDLLSLELEDSFSDLYLRKDPTPIFLAAKALMLLQQRHGLFPRITGKGDNAKRLADLLIRMRSEVAAGDDSSQRGGTPFGLTPSSTVDSLIIIDREVDFATPMVTQLTYEGLIEESMGIRHNQNEVDSSIVGGAPTQQTTTTNSSKSPAPTQAPQGMKRKIQLDSSDKLYEQLRSLNFAVVGGRLNQIARRLESDYQSRHSAKSTSELREFVSKLPSYQSEQQSLKVHTGLAEEILNYTQTEFFTRSLEVQHNLVGGADPSTIHEDVEELIARDAPLATVLRLLCLESCLCGGLSTKDLDNFSRAILQAYGFQHLLTLSALAKMQLLQSRNSANALRFPGTQGYPVHVSQTTYSSVRKSLRLIVDEVKPQDPTDIAYVYSGYAPLSVRLVQCIVQKSYLLSLTKGDSGNNGHAPGGAGQGWRGFEEVVKNVKGKTFDEVQRGEDKAVRARMILNGQSERKTVLVFFLGGITFTEIAALRFIAKKEEGKKTLNNSFVSGELTFYASQVDDSSSSVRHPS
jgi:hypothetical protein